MRFSHLKLQNWRNFAKLDIDLYNRVFLVGPNASGKSNFLQVFRFLRDISSVGGGLQEATVRKGGISSIRCLSAKRVSDIVIDVRVQNDQTNWQYHLTFNQDSQKRPKIKKEIVKKNEFTILERPDATDKTDPLQLTQTHLEQVNSNKKFRELADFFTSIRYLHIVPQIVREPGKWARQQKDPYGGDFLEQVRDEKVKTREARLRRIKSALKIAVPQLKELIFYRDKHGIAHLRGLYEHWRPQGAWQTEDQFSDGTLRLIGLLWALLDEKGPLLLEEPELSLHPELIQHIPQMTARLQSEMPRQIFISTHSKDLLRDNGIGLHEVLLLIPSTEGTEIRPAKRIQEIAMLLENGISMADAVFPLTSPKNANQLSLFND
jgi:predicted ATPase